MIFFGKRHLLSTFAISSIPWFDHVRFKDRRSIAFDRRCSAVDHSRFIRDVNVFYSTKGDEVLVKWIYYIITATMRNYYGIRSYLDLRMGFVACGE